jgi:hypothetical protein
MFSYCINNPVILADSSGYAAMVCITDKVDELYVPWKNAGGGGGRAYNQPSSLNVDTSNTSAEESVLNAKFAAFYNGILFVKIPAENCGLSFGVVFLAGTFTNREFGIQTVQHEFGHTVQLREYGFYPYLFGVGIPSFINAQKQKAGKLQVPYYSQPWEFEADLYGNVTGRTYEPWAVDAYLTYKAAMVVFSIFWDIVG